jgi:hypothetical protein
MPILGSFDSEATPPYFKNQCGVRVWREGCLRVGARTASECLFGPQAVRVTKEQPLYI